MTLRACHVLLVVNSALVVVMAVSVIAIALWRLDAAERPASRSSRGFAVTIAKPPLASPATMPVAGEALSIQAELRR